MTEYLDDKLKAYAQSDAYPFHMPGHKRRADVLDGRAVEDITEIDGFDDLYHADGILMEAQQRASALYQAAQSFYLVGGSTVGILTAIFAGTKDGDEILVARNCHRSVYHAALLRRLKVRYVMPQMTSFGFCGSLDPAEIKRQIEAHPQAKVLVMTSPTYEGVVSDLETISTYTKAAGMKLIVDEAHGAHLALSSRAPMSAVGFADYTIQSLHKTLPCYTQTALLHAESLKEAEDAAFYLRIFQTSSPSYLLMSGMDACIRQMSCEGDKLLEKMYERLDTFYRRCAQLSSVKVALPQELSEEVYDFDCSKVMIYAHQMSGTKIAAYLREHAHLELEMANEAYALAMVTMMDTEEGFSRLEKALFDLDQTLSGQVQIEADGGWTFARKRCLEMFEAHQAPGKSVAIEEASDLISGEFVYLYPPGIPVLVPGEVIEPALIAQIERWKSRGLSVQGMQDPDAKVIRVLDRRQ